MILVIATLAAVFLILQIFGVFEIMLTSQKVVSEIKENRKLGKERKREKGLLAIYSQTTNMFRGILMNELQYEKHNYWIQRLEIRATKLDRLYTPEELRGKYAFPLMLSLLVIPLAIFNILFLAIPLFFLGRFIVYPLQFDTKIRDEDEIIDNYFIDLYLLLYSKLRQGSRARLQTTVENYIDTLQESNTTEVKDVMLKLSKYLLNLLSLYEDHVAVPKLKEIYHSATIINFCNVATQSLNGVENYDNLLTFKMQLVERKTELMRERSAALVRKGEMSIYAIYII
jgi:hypothetical protein